MDKYFLDLQFFSDGTEGGGEEFDFDAFDKQFEESYQDDPEPTEEEQESSIEEGDPAPAPADGGEGEPTPEGDNDKPEGDDVDPAIHDDDVHKRNEAFRQLREQAQEGEKFKAFVQKVADLNGMTPEQVIQKFEEQQIQQEAQAKGVDPEVYKRIRTLEEENKQTKQEALKERFNAQANQVMTKYDVSFDEMKEFIREASEKGIDLYNTDMEVVFKGLRHEHIVAKEVEKAQNEYLNNKKQRQQQSAEPHKGGSQTNDNDYLDDIAKEVAKEVADW